MKLWDKGYDTDKEVLNFTTGEDYILDMKLLKHDCIASIAHAKMLHKIGILKKNELSNLEKGLNEIIELNKLGKFIIKKEDEDCHTAIENYLTKKYGDAGKKIHTARSRNDQILVALKLYMKQELNLIKLSAEAFVKSLKEFGKSDVKIPGYTHMRKAMPSSIKMWTEGYTEAIISDIIIINAALNFIDSCPLGSAAGYGVSLPIDRKYVAELLGFSKVESITHAQISRGKNEAVVISALMNIMFDLNKIASDLILFSMTELGYFKIPNEFCTGSSIMPHKQNPDVLELIRGKSKVVESYYFQTSSIIQNLPSGYNRDFQLTKKPLMDSFEITKNSLTIMTKLIKNLKIDKENCEKAMTDELFSTEKAYELVKKGLPFRDAYKNIGSSLLAK